MTAEIAEQPEVLARLLDTAGPAVPRGRRRSSARPRRASCCSPPAAPATTPRSTASTSPRSDWAGPPVSPRPSSMTAYGAKPDLRDVLFVAVSQSGASPDLVESTTTARACGALTLAVTNNAAVGAGRGGPAAPRRARRSRARGRGDQDLLRRADDAVDAGRRAVRRRLLRRCRHSGGGRRLRHLAVRRRGRSSRRCATSAPTASC